MKNGKNPRRKRRGFLYANNRSEAAPADYVLRRLPEDLQ
jgi:hypothetical protein